MISLSEYINESIINEGILDKIKKTYDKIEAYMLHSPDLMASMHPANVDMFYKALRNMRMIIDNEKIQD